MKIVLTASLLLLASAMNAQDFPKEKSADGAEAYIVSPADGSTVTSPVTVIFGLKGMGVAPAGSIVANTGHHHLLVNAELPDLAKPVPADESHLHFGGGQTQHDLVLPPGKHTLRLVLGDRIHLPHDPPVYSETITITVVE